MSWLEKKGVKHPDWKFISQEYNINSRKHIISAPYAVEVVKGIQFKAYQHEHMARAEIIERRVVSLPEVLSVFHALTGTLDGSKALAEIREMKRELKKVDERSREAYQTAAVLKDQQARKVFT
jgi:hypothetical protein